MKKATNQHRTLVDLIRAADRKQAVTLTALKEEKDEAGRKTGRLVQTVRTVEIYDFRVSQQGDIRLVSMDRETGEERAFRIDRILFYTVHRSAFVVPCNAQEQPDFWAAPELADLGPIEIIEMVIGRMLDRADRAEERGCFDLELTLRRSAHDLEWVTAA
jgi:hypothetical protein